jgi:signal transduction histidine kinase
VTGHFGLDWALLAVSFFNTILPLWLGLTVLLNANRRDWGVWLMGGGLLVGAVFFISHSAILGQELAVNFDGLNFWWRAGWFGITVAPFVWYIAVLWFSGYWRPPQESPARPPTPSLADGPTPNRAPRYPRRHRLPLWLMSLWLAGLLLLLLAANPIPSYAELLPLRAGAGFAVRGVPVLFLLFPLFTLACILLSLDVLRRPAAVEDAATRVARRRALPWLLGTAGALLAVALVATYFVATVVIGGVRGAAAPISLATVAAYDLALSLLIALAVLLLGQALVAYEIFTGRVLPRRSFVRHWRYAVLLAGGYAIVVGWSIVVDLRPIYALLLATLLLTLFYALYVWRSLREREQVVARLRPFVQRGALTPDPLGATLSAQGLLAVLCRDILGTRHAQLIPQGRLASLVTAPLRYGPGTGGASAGITAALPPLPETLQGDMTPLEGAAFAPYSWAITLRDARERIGVLLIAPKQDRGLYSQEEMETAQAAGERVLHLLGGEQMLLRLLDLQRKRTAGQRVVDQRTRRALHDEILPSLHLAVLQLSGANRSDPAIAAALTTLAETHQGIADLLAATQPPAGGPGAPYELVAALRALVETEFAHTFERIEWRGIAAEPAPHAAPGTAADAVLYVDPLVGEVILGAVRETIRNAAAHGRGAQSDRPLSLRIDLTAPRGAGDDMKLAIADDGVGFGRGPAAGAIPARANDAADSLPRGSGNGLALHGTLLALVGGRLTADSPPEGGTLVTIAVPTST